MDPLQFSISGVFCLRCLGADSKVRDKCTHCGKYGTFIRFSTKITAGHIHKKSKNDPGALESKLKEFGFFQVVE